MKQSATMYAHYVEMMSAWKSAKIKESADEAELMLFDLAQRHDEDLDSSWYIVPLSVMYAAGRCQKSLLEEAISSELSGRHAFLANQAMEEMMPYDPIRILLR